MSERVIAMPPVRPGRVITGISAILLPLAEDGAADWHAFEQHVQRTVDAGLTPAVNMDTGYVQLLSPADRDRALEIAASVTAGAFVAGAFVEDSPGVPFDAVAYVRAATAIADRGGTPVIFPSYGLNALSDDALVAALVRIGGQCGRFIGFELGPMFVPYGRIYSLDAYAGMMDITQCIGAKHSSLSRPLEWERLALRDARRPEFKVFTGNDLAIDMVMWGSDYLLGLSTFAPSEFALRDRLWAAGDPAFFELNDLLQYLGQFAFRAPVPAYRHDAAMFFHVRGWSRSDRTMSGVPERPASDRDVLVDIRRRLEGWT